MFLYQLEAKHGQANAEAFQTNKVKSSLGHDSDSPSANRSSNVWNDKKQIVMR